MKTCKLKTKTSTRPNQYLTPNWVTQLLNSGSSESTCCWHHCLLPLLSTVLGHCQTDPSVTWRQRTIAIWLVEGETNVKEHFRDLYEIILQKQWSDTLKAFLNKQKSFFPALFKSAKEKTQNKRGKQRGGRGPLEI